MRSRRVPAGWAAPCWETFWGCDRCPGSGSPCPVLEVPASGSSPPRPERLASESPSAPCPTAPPAGRLEWRPQKSPALPSPPPSPSSVLPSSLIIRAHTEPRVRFRSASSVLGISLRPPNTCAACVGPWLRGWGQGASTTGVAVSALQDPGSSP